MRNTIKTNIRSFKRKPGINLINIIGLSVSLVLVFILSIYCYSELTTDLHHKNGDRVYLLNQPGSGMHTPAVLKENIDMKVPGVSSTVRISGTWSPPVYKVENDYPIVSDLLFADTDFFNLFTYKVLQGDLSNALGNPLSVVITEALEKKLFGNEKALGKTIKYNNDELLTVSAVIEEPVGNTFLSFSAVTSIETRKIIQPSEGEFTEWSWSNFQTFVLLDNNINDKETAKTIFSLFPEKHKEWIEEINLLPLRDIYFAELQTSDKDYFQQGDKNKAIVLLLVAGLILVIALVNFINISSSQWMERINRTGILKVIGASRIHILKGIMSESFLLFFVSALIAFVLVLGITSIIQDFTGMSFNLELIISPGYIVILFAAILILSLIFSLIPGLKISSAKVIDSLNNKANKNNNGSLLRYSLITLQFVISIVLTSFTLLIYKQITYGSNNLVFNQNNTIALKLTKQLKKDVLKNELSDNPLIQDVSFSQFYPGKQLSGWTTPLQLNGQEHEVRFNTFCADEGFFKIMGLELLNGRLYSDDLSNDQIEVVVNEAFQKKINLADPIGGTFGPEEKYKIVGVIKDFHFKSYNTSIEPLVIRNDGYASYCLASLQSADFGSLHSVIHELKTTVSNLSPAFPVEISFLDNAVNKMYESEVRFRRTFSLFSISAIVICSIGILAMSIFASQRRTKEIGIRKVNGARLTEIMAMLNGDFIKWVVIAFILASPIAWFVMNKWLESFAYRTDISWWIFALAGAIALVVALVAVSWQSWRAASMNPIKALRYE